MSIPNACVHYVRVLTQFGRLVEGARKHQQMTIDRLSALSGITVRRLRKYEAADAPPHWADALRLAQVLDIRMSFIVSALRRPLLELSLDEHKSLVAFVYAQGAQQRQGMRADISRSRMVHLEDSSDESVHDATLTEWPEFLPPLLGDALMAEASTLHTMYRVLDMVADHGGGPVPIELESDSHATVPIQSAELLTRVHCSLERTRARLEWLRSRHVVSAPPHFAERLEIQRYRIGQAMKLITPHWVTPTGESLKGDSIHLSGADNRQFSADVSEAIGRAISASYGLTKMARQSFLTH